MREGRGAEEKESIHLRTFRVSFHAKERKKDRQKGSPCHPICVDQSLL
jgi:hypothetical protein